MGNKKTSIHTTEPFASLYKPTPEDSFPGIKKYTPPKVFAYGDWYLVSEVKPANESDGHTVKIFECRMPATFFKLEVKGRIIDGKRVPGYQVGTGTVERKVVAELVTAIADGMVKRKIIAKYASAIADDMIVFKPLEKAKK